MTMNAFNALMAVDVSGHVEKKNGLSYLPWAWAWAELKKRYPASYFTIYEAQNGCFYHTDGKTAWVKTGVTLVDGDEKLEHIEYLPVMNVRNQSIPLASVTSTDVNKTIQRSLTKAAARHGLGLYVYAGEDLPEDAPTTNATPAPAAKATPAPASKAETAPTTNAAPAAKIDRRQSFNTLRQTYGVKNDDILATINAAVQDGCLKGIKGDIGTMPDKDFARCMAECERRFRAALS